MRKIFLTIVCLAVGVAVSAQTANQEKVYEETVEYANNPHKVVTNGFWDNWFVSAGVGAQMYFGDNDSEAKFGKRITPAFEIAGGKWFTPVVGARLMLSGFTAKGASANSHLTGEAIPGTSLGYAKFSLIHLHGDFMLNARALFEGYCPEKIWTPVLYAGMGYVRAPKNNELSHSLGFMNSFKITDALDINLDVRGMIGNDDLDGDIGGMNYEGLLTTTVGVTYKFNERGWKTEKTVYRYDRTEANALMAKLDAAEAENAGLKKALSDSEAKRVELENNPVVIEIVSDDIVLFPIGKTALSREARVNLKGFASMVKESNPENVYVITGYADKATGSEKRNMQLSKGRAEAAYNCLVKDYGVNPDQLQVEYKGGVDNMYFDDPALNRAVVITLKK